MPRFISLEAALTIHHDQIDVFGGLHGLRDADLLQSALGAARHTFDCSGDLFEAAAQYCVSVARNHPFLDGNKRVAADCLLTFLVLNGFEPTMTPGRLFEWVLRVATGDMERPELAANLRKHSARRGNR